VGAAATEDPAQRIATVAAGFREMFSIMNALEPKFSEMWNRQKSVPHLRGRRIKKT